MRTIRDERAHLAAACGSARCGAVRRIIAQLRSEQQQSLLCQTVKCFARNVFFFVFVKGNTEHMEKAASTSPNPGWAPSTASSCKQFNKCSCEGAQICKVCKESVLCRRKPLPAPAESLWSGSIEYSFDSLDEQKERKSSAPSCLWVPFRAPPCSARFVGRTWPDLDKVCGEQSAPLPLLGRKQSRRA